MQVLVLGGAGQVGIELQRACRRAAIDVSAPDRSRLDITHEESVATAIAERPWDAVINAAAYTAVDRAESDVAAAWRLNALAPAILASETARRRIPIVHISTDYVFDGASPRPYLETDPVAPLSVYGASKEGGEQAVRTGNRRHAIVRTAWVVSAHRSNFLKTMLRLGAERTVLRVVDDQHGCPTSAADLAASLVDIASGLARNPEAPTGTYHFVNAGETTWCGFAREIFRQVHGGGGVTPPMVEPTPTSGYPTPARRPMNSRLSTAALVRDYGIRPRPWQEALSDILLELGAKASPARPQGAKTEAKP